MDSSRPSGGSTPIDLDLVTEAVDRDSVECAILCGSSVRGRETVDSDVDVAVAFEDGLTPRERLKERIEIVVSLGVTLGTDDVDVADLESIRPEIGLSAVNTGLVLVGEDEHLDIYRERFERAVAENEDETHDDRMRRFDSILERLEAMV